jgi:hypothetical protein
MAHLDDELYTHIACILIASFRIDSAVPAISNIMNEGNQ